RDQKTPVGSLEKPVGVTAGKQSHRGRIVRPPTEGPFIGGEDPTLPDWCGNRNQLRGEEVVRRSGPGSLEPGPCTEAHRIGWPEDVEMAAGHFDAGFDRIDLGSRHRPYRRGHCTLPTDPDGAGRRPVPYGGGVDAQRSPRLVFGDLSPL